MKNWLTRLLFDWVFVLLYRLFQAFLRLVDFIESFFDIFAGTAKITYNNNSEFLINVFFGHSAVSNAFWAMALIAIVLAFGFCIVQVSRKAADITGSVKQSVGQIMSNFFRCLLIILLLNLVTVTAINITNVLLDRINFALENAAVLHQEESDKSFSEQEYATMTRILATVANYSVNPSADSRYNVNSCFNAIRPDLLSLYVNGFFQYDYPLDPNGHYSWQGALSLLAASTDLTADLNLDVYYADVANAVQVVSKELSTYREFAPVETAHFSVPESINTDTLIFLIAGMNASQNRMYNDGDFNDALRKGYISGEKSYNDLTRVRKDFDIWEMDYLVGYVSCIVFIIIMAICIFTFIVRMFNLLLLYLTSPLFASSMPMDDGGKWQSWTQAFVIQLFSGFGIIVAMRLYLIIIPITLSKNLVFFENSYLNRMAQLLMVLGGAWAVLQAGSVITGILAGNPGMAAIQQEGRIGSMVSSWAMRAPRAAMGTAKSIMGAPVKAGQGIKSLKGRVQAHHDNKSQRMARKGLKRQNKADALFDKADKKMAEGKSGRSVGRTMNKAFKAQDRAASTSDKLAHRQAKYGQAAYQSKKDKPSYTGIGSDSFKGMGSDEGFSDIQVSKTKNAVPAAGAGASDIRASRAKSESSSSGPRVGATKPYIPPKEILKAAGGASAKGGTPAKGGIPAKGGTPAKGGAQAKGGKGGTPAKGGAPAKAAQGARSGRAQPKRPASGKRSRPQHPANSGKARPTPPHSGAGSGKAKPTPPSSGASAPRPVSGASSDRAQSTSPKQSGSTPPASGGGAGKAQTAAPRPTAGVGAPSGGSGSSHSGVSEINIPRARPNVQAKAESLTTPSGVGYSDIRVTRPKPTSTPQGGGPTSGSAPLPKRNTPPKGGNNSGSGSPPRKR